MAPRVLPLFTLAILLAGCAAPSAAEYRWRATRSDSNFDRDRYECRREAAGVPQTPMPSGGPPPYPSGGGFVEGLRAGQAMADYREAVAASRHQQLMQMELFSLCLENRGWVFEEVPR